MKGIKAILITVLVSNLFCQTFQLGNQTFINVSNNWYKSDGDNIGSKIIPEILMFSYVSGNSVDAVNLGQHGLDISSIIKGPIANKYYLMEIPISLDPFNIALSLYADPAVDYIGFDVITTRHAVPNDPYYINQSWNLSMVDMETAWDYSSGGNDIIVAVIDLGIDITHEDLDGNIWSNIHEINGSTNLDDDGNGYIDDYYGWDFSGNGDNDPNPDYLGEMHGTQCAGIISAKIHNNLGVAGVAGGWNGSGGVKIMVLKEYTLSGVVEAIYYAVNNGATIISMSGGYSESDISLQNAVNYASNNDVIFIASVGNDNDNAIAFPAAYPNTIAVGGTDIDDTRWDDGSRGSNWGDELDILAPAGWRDIFSLIPWSDYSFQWYEMFGATSAAAPHVSGEAALIKSLWPEKTWVEVREVIRKSSEKVGPYEYDQNGWNEYYGYGRINIGYAIAPPATPQNFTVSGNEGDNPTCSWSAGNTEPDLSGYKLYKNEAGSGWALFRTLDKNTTSYTDNSVIIGSGGKFSDNVCYKVSAYDITNQESTQSWSRCKPLGSVSKQMVDFELELIPNKYAINPAYPNPFNPSTKISYQLPNESQVSLLIYSLQGQLVRSLISSKQKAGYYTIVWNGLNNAGESVSSGMYLILINASSTEDNSAFIASRKVVLLR